MSTFKNNLCGQSWNIKKFLQQATSKNNRDVSMRFEITGFDCDERSNNNSIITKISWLMLLFQI